MSSKAELRAIASQPVVSLRQFAAVQVAAGSPHADATRRATAHSDTVDRPDRTPQPLRRDSQTIDFRTRTMRADRDLGFEAAAAAIKATTARQPALIVDDKANRHLPDNDPRKT